LNQIKEESLSEKESHITSHISLEKVEMKEDKIKQSVKIIAKEKVSTNQIEAISEISSGVNESIAESCIEPVNLQHIHSLDTNPVKDNNDNNADIDKKASNNTKGNSSHKDIVISKEEEPIKMEEDCSKECIASTSLASKDHNEEFNHNLENEIKVDKSEIVAAPRKHKPTPKSPIENVIKTDSSTPISSDTASMADVKASLDRELAETSDSKVDTNQRSLINPDYEPVETKETPEPVYEVIPGTTTTPDKDNDDSLNMEPAVNGTTSKVDEFSRECIPPVRPIRSKKAEKLQVPEWTAPKQTIFQYLFSCFHSRKC